MAATSGVICVLARSVLRSSTAGFVRSGLYPCAPRKSSASTTADHFSAFFIRLGVMTRDARPPLA
jgi:hypothetical protein